MTLCGRTPCDHESPLDEWRSYFDGAGELVTRAIRYPRQANFSRLERITRTSS